MFITVQMKNESNLKLQLTMTIGRSVHSFAYVCLLRLILQIQSEETAVTSTETEQVRLFPVTAWFDFIVVTSV